MEFIRKVVNRNLITGQTVNFIINLTQEYENMGYMTDFSNDLTLNAVKNVTITGITESKLSSVRSYDYNNPYKVGINGVTEVTSTYVKYNINGVNYSTNLADLSTTFSTIDVNQDYKVDYFIFEERNLSYVDKIFIDNSVFIERQNISVMESFSKLRQISSVTEIETFNNGFYKIFDQTI